MSLASVILTSSLTCFAIIQSAQPFVLTSSVSPLPPLPLAPVNQRASTARRHDSRLERRSLNVAYGPSSRVSLVSAKGGARRIAINDDGQVIATLTPYSVYSTLEVQLLCSVAKDLSLDFPDCRTRETALTEATSTEGNQSILSFVLLFFRHSARFLCIDRNARVYSLPQIGDYKSKVSECVFHHDINNSSNYDSYYSRQYSPGGGPASRCHGSRKCHVGRWYLSVNGSKVTTRKTSRPPPQVALFIQLHDTSSSFKNSQQFPMREFSVPGPTSTQSTPVAGSGQGKEGRKRGTKGGRRRTTQSTSPFSVSQRRPGGERRRKKGGRKCGENLLGRCDSRKTTSGESNARNILSGGLNYNTTQGQT